MVDGLFVNLLIHPLGLRSASHCAAGRVTNMQIRCVLSGAYNHLGRKSRFTYLKNCKELEALTWNEVFPPLTIDIYRLLL